MIRTRTAGIVDVMPDQYGFHASILPYFPARLPMIAGCWIVPCVSKEVFNTTEAQDEAKLAVLKALRLCALCRGQSKMAGGAAVLSYNKGDQ